MFSVVCSVRRGAVMYYVKDDSSAGWSNTTDVQDALRWIPTSDVEVVRWRRRAGCHRQLGATVHPTRCHQDRDDRRLSTSVPLCRQIRRLRTSL